MQTFDRLFPTKTAAVLSAPVQPGAAEVLASLLLSGLTGEEISRLADLRARAQRGAYADDGYGTIFGSPLADQRLAFARWLVRTGRLDDGLPPKKGCP